MRITIRVALLAALLTIATCLSAEAVTRFSAATTEKKTPAGFPFDDIWFYRDGTKIIPEIGTRWLTVVFDPRYSSYNNEFDSTYSSFIQEKAKALINAHRELVDFFYDRNLAEDACFFRMREGMKPAEIRELINQLNQDEAIVYTHPTIVINDTTYAFFNVFYMEWKTGADKARRETLLREVHVVFDEKENYYSVNVLEIPFFKALDLLAEDISVLKVTPNLVELKPTIRTQLTLLMNGGNIGDSIPFTLTITFSDRVSIDPSSLATINLRPSTIQKELFDCTFAPYDYTKAVTKSPILITGRMKFYAPGEFSIPPVTINYTCPTCSGNTVRSVETKPVLFKVASIIPAAKSENQLIVLSDTMNPDYHFDVLHKQSLFYLWSAIATCSVFILCAAWFIVLIYNLKAEKYRLKLRKPEDLLAERLRLLLQGTASVPHWRYMGETGMLLREYIAVRFGINLKYLGGSGKQFIQTIKDHIPHEWVDPLTILYWAIDTIVAQELENYPDIKQLQDEMLKLLGQTAAQN